MPSHGLDFDKSSFDAFINKLVEEFKPVSILETGTFMGTGTTQTFGRTGLPVTTIECCEHHHFHATNNLKGFPNVTCLRGYSLKRADMENFVQADSFQPPLGVALDVEDQHKVGFYLGELRQGELEEDLLLKNLKPNQLVFLDSAGGVGWLEFRAVLTSPVRPLLLVMDDVFHYKHFRSAEFLIGNGFPYRAHDRWGYCWLGDK